MKLLLSLAVVVQLLVKYAAAVADATNTLASADYKKAFYIWNTYVPRHHKHSSIHQFAFFHDYEAGPNGTITCDQLTSVFEIYRACGDASSYWCVVCEGDDDACDYDYKNPDKITRLEFHTSWAHNTYYKYPEQQIRDGNKVVGSCVPWSPEHGVPEMDCKFPDSSDSLRERNRKGAPALYCKWDIWQGTWRAWGRRALFRREDEVLAQVAGNGVTS
ncbi:hypothetical protein QBC34DRAFT_379277 [Podospora aff. communis PSN243]|uniref:Secreted protein n=1 Tax=Podospora aff. communis PSN243 TaxID=3040156 RepID=A0AAV9GQF1_9PEZI|nr:hypothetical protein QBC34DRAFT_379277 [Podospora aff. communis PSN243]